MIFIPDIPVNIALKKNFSCSKGSSMQKQTNVKNTAPIQSVEKFTSFQNQKCIVLFTSMIN
jgi:hypothetical protein